jgi:hypothetical protein
MTLATAGAAVLDFIWIRAAKIHLLRERRTAA